MSELKDYFAKHQQEFDAHEPAPGHFERFEARLLEVPAPSRIRHGSSLVYRLAAVLLFLVALSFVIYFAKTDALHSGFGITYTAVELPADIREAIQYYDGVAVRQLGEIDDLAGSDLQARHLSQSARNEIRSLDENTAMLKQAFRESPGNDRILAALVQNQQMKEKITSTILEQLNQNKKQ
jgi:hypothetical protein